MRLQGEPSTPRTPFHSFLLASCELVHGVRRVLEKGSPSLPRPWWWTRCGGQLVPALSLPSPYPLKLRRSLRTRSGHLQLPAVPPFTVRGLPRLRPTFFSWVSPGDRPAAVAQPCDPPHAPQHCLFSVHTVRRPAQFGWSAVSGSHFAPGLHQRLLFLSSLVFFDSRYLQPNSRPSSLLGQLYGPARPNFRRDYKQTLKTSNNRSPTSPSNNNNQSITTLLVIPLSRFLCASEPHLHTRFAIHHCAPPHSHISLHTPISQT